MTTLRNKLTYSQLIVISFFLIILIGAILLSMPFSSRSGEWTSFFDSFFTATSATCVTGLVVFDTYTHWSIYGQIVILILIQIGGLGVMTCIAMLALLLKKKIQLGERRLIMQQAGALEISGIVLMLKRIIKGTFIVEGIGAVILSVEFCQRLGILRGIWYGVFHSVSAFCNAGFDLMGRYQQFSSFSTEGLYNNPIINIVLMCLIIIGGIGFMVWGDFTKNKFNFKKYQVHSKIVLSVSAVLILGGAILFFIFEYGNSISDMSFGQKILSSFFQSVTTRTAGFNTTDLSGLTNSSVLLFAVLMLIGGSPGSTAGGIKTTTFAVVLLATRSSARRSRTTSVFKRTIDNDTVKQAYSVIIIYILTVLIAMMIICALEPYSLSQIMFETISAVGTVGLSMGITPSLCTGSRIIIIMLMFLGRVGGLTLVVTFAERLRKVPLSRPNVKILVG